MMKKILVIFFLLVIIGVSVFFIITSGQKQEIIRLEETIEFLKEETVPIKFKILTKTDSGMTIAIKFYNADKKEINKTEMTLNGKELSFDFITIKAGDRYISFPAKVFTDRIPAREGEKLFSYYDENGIPGVLVYDGIRKELLNNLKVLFKTIKNDTPGNVKNSFGNLVHDIEKISSFKTGIVYKIVVHVKGGIEVLQD
ncbi:MAG: hypothetical protein JXJ04_20310 [Spirochaetales bacterium]|nr:hypothetical protein [Spirochaetales bacterium]